MPVLIASPTSKQDSPPTLPHHWMIPKPLLYLGALRISLCSTGSGSQVISVFTEMSFPHSKEPFSSPILFCVQVSLQTLTVSKPFALW